MVPLGGKYWKSYGAKLHEPLLPAQNANGSWGGRVNDDVQFGPNYCTSMAVLALTVEYRLLPIYQRDEDAAEEKQENWNWRCDMREPEDDKAAGIKAAGIECGQTGQLPR